MGDLSPEGVVCLQSVYFVNKGTKPAATVDDSTYLTIFLPFKLSNVKKKFDFICVCLSPDASAVGPVTGHASAGQQGGDGLVEQEVISDQLLLLGIGHACQGVVLSLELTLQVGQG